MEFSTRLNGKQFKQVRYALWQENKRRIWVHRIMEIFVFAWLVIPFVQVMLLGMSRRVSFWTVCKTYPMFFVTKGWASPAFFLALALCIATFAPIIYLFSGSKQYQQFCQKTKIAKIVFSDVRFCGYSEDNVMYMGYPYSGIREILWLDRLAVIVVNTKQSYPVVLKDMTEEQQEEFIKYLQAMKNRTVELTEPLQYSFENVAWQAEIQLTDQDMEDCFAMYHSAVRNNGWKLLVVAGVFGLLSLFGVLQLPLLCLMAAFAARGILTLMPKNEKRHLKKTIKEMPEYIEFESGTTLLTEQGMHRHQKQYYNYFEWGQLTHTIIGSAGILVMKNYSLAGFIPRRSFENDGEFLRYAHWIEGRIQQEKQKKIVPLIQKG